VLQADEKQLLSGRQARPDGREELLDPVGPDAVVREMKLPQLRPLHQGCQGGHTLVSKLVLVQLHYLQ